jgi:hypothetical protein
MKVKFKATFCGIKDYYQGQEYDVSDLEASSLISNGFAEAVDNKIKTAKVEIKAQTANKKL